MNTERLMIYKEVSKVEVFNDYEAVYNIDGLIAWLLEMKSKGATVLNWSASAWDNEVNEIDCSVYVSTPESDEQYNARIEKEKKFRENHLQNVEMIEKMQYEKLKAKFDK